MAAPNIKKKRRTQKELFVDALSKLSNGTGEKITNTAMINKLGWNAEQYERIKGLLIDDEIIIKGRARGGAISLVNKEKKRALKIFVSYSHEDEEIKNELIKHLSPLKRTGLINAWHDREIKAGEEWNEVIFKELRSADIILLLVSIDFINSEFCYNKELESAMERHDDGEACVIPIIVRRCLWDSTLFAKLQAVPKDGTPILAWKSRDDAYVDVVKHIQSVVKQLQEAP